MDPFKNKFLDAYLVEVFPFRIISDFFSYFLSARKFGVSAVQFLMHVRKNEKKEKTKTKG